MTNLIATEFLKLRTTRGPWLTIGIEVLLVIVGVSGLASRGLDASDPQQVQLLFAHAGLAAFVTLIFGIGAFGTEYRYKTITDTYLTTPDRRRVMLAKVATYALAGLAFGVVTAATALAAAAAWGAADGVSLDLLGNEAWLTLGGAVAWNVLFAVIGVGLGALLPNQSTAIAVALTWIALVEGLVAQLLGGLAEWLPLSAARALGNAPAQDLLPQLGGGAVLAGYAVLLVIAAAAVSARRDVA